MSIPLPVREALSNDRWMLRCIHAQYKDDPTPCSGRVEWEHSQASMGRNIQEPWAIVPVCTYHHRQNGLDKRFNRLLALLRATDDQLQAHSKGENLLQTKAHLLTVYLPLCHDLNHVPIAPVCLKSS